MVARFAGWPTGWLVGGLIDKVGGKVKLRAGRPGFCGGVGGGDVIGFTYWYEIIYHSCRMCV